MTEHPTPQSTDATPPPNCPKCQGPMWDNRVGKRNPKAPDFKCKDRECDGVVWPPRDAKPVAAATGAPATSAPAAGAVKAGASKAGAKAGGTNADGMPSCPVCGGAMWDDRASKRNPRAPDFKCKNKPRERGGPGCEGVIWPPRDGAPSPYPAAAPRRTPADAPWAGGMASSGPARFDAPPIDDAPPHDDDDLPF
jgi:hypothetical protein